MKDNFRAWEIEPLPEVNNLSKAEMMKHLAGWAILAPNAHNIQPWKFILNPAKNTIAICLDKRGILHASDKDGRQAVIGLGCSIANLLLASKYYGLINDLRLPSENETLKLEPGILAEIVFKEWQPKICGEFFNFMKAMKNRRVNRGKYDPQKEIPEEFEKTISETAKIFGTKLYTIRDMLTKIAISEIQFNADQHVMFTKKFREELRDVILPNDTDQYVGIPGGTLGLSDETTIKVIDELKREMAGDPDVLSGNAYVGREGIKSSPLVCVIAGKNDTPHWWLKAGITFGAIAAAAEAAVLNTAVHAAIIEVKILRASLKLRLFASETPLVLFRLGYATENKPRSPRLNVESVVEIVN